MKVLILAGFKPLGTEWGMAEGFESNGHEWSYISTNPARSKVNHPIFAKQVLQKFERGNFDTIIMCKGSPIQLDVYKIIADGADITYWCNDSVSGRGCGPTNRPNEVGPRGHLANRIACTGTEGIRWFRTNGYDGRMAQIYQGCRHSIWRPEKFEPRDNPSKELCFLGSAQYRGDGGRRAKFKFLKQKGHDVHFAKRTFHHDAAKLYRDSKICLNFSCGTPGEGRCPAGITSNRVVRILSSGGFCLTELNTDIAHTFNDGEQLAWFGWQEMEEMIEKVNHYLSRPEERKEISVRGWEWSKDWSWDHQVEKLVRFIRGEDVPADGAAGKYIEHYSEGVRVTEGTCLT